MATVKVRSSVLEDGMFQDQWQAFASDLRAEGHEVEGVGHSGQFSKVPADLPDPLTIVITIWVAEKMAGAAISSAVTQVVNAVGKHLRGRFAGASRKVEIVDGDGNVLKVVEVEDDPASDQPVRRKEEG